MIASLIFHSYQPPAQSAPVLRKVCRETYRPLIDLVGESGYARGDGQRDRRTHRDIGRLWAPDRDRRAQYTEEQSAVTLNAAKAIRLSKPNEAMRGKLDDLIPLAQDVGRRLFEHLGNA